MFSVEQSLKSVSYCSGSFFYREVINITYKLPDLCQFVAELDLRGVIS